MNGTNASALLRLGICLQSFRPVADQFNLRRELDAFVATPSLDNLDEITGDLIEMQYENDNHGPRPVTSYERISEHMRSRVYCMFRIAFETTRKLLSPEEQLDDSEISSTISRIEELFDVASSILEAVNSFEPILGYPHDTYGLP